MRVESPDGDRTTRIAVRAKRLKTYYGYSALRTIVMKRLAGDRLDFADQRKRLVLENRKTCRKIQKSSQVLAKMDGNIALAVHERSRRIPIPSYFEESWYGQSC